MRLLAVLTLLAFVAAGRQVCAEDKVQVAISFSKDINKVVDTLLALVRVVLQEQGLEQVALPDFTETFRKRVGPVRVTGKFEGYSGWAKSLTSIARTGNAIATGEGTNIAIEVPLGFQDLQAGYRYKAKLSKIKTGGHVRVEVASNSVRLRASLVITGTECSVGVDSLDLVDLGKIRVKEATGLGPLNFLLKKVGGWVAKRAHGKIEEQVRDALKKVIAKAGLKFKC